MEPASVDSVPGVKPEPVENHPPESKPHSGQIAEEEIGCPRDNMSGNSTSKVDKRATIQLKVRTDMFPAKENEQQSSGTSINFKLVERKSNGSTEIFDYSIPLAEEELQITYHFNAPKSLNNETLPFMVLTLVGNTRLKIAVRDSVVPRNLDYWKHLRAELKKDLSHGDVLSLTLPSKVLNSRVVKTYNDLKVKLTHNEETFCFTNAQAKTFSDNHRKEFDQALISYALKGKDFFVIDLSKEPYIRPPFAFILESGSINDHTRMKARIVLEFCLRVFKITNINVNELEKSVFNKSKTVEAYHGFIKKSYDTIIRDFKGIEKSTTGPSGTTQLLKPTPQIIRVAAPARPGKAISIIQRPIFVATKEPTQHAAHFEMARNGRIVMRKGVSFPETCKLCMMSFSNQFEFNRHLYKHMSVSISLGIQRSNLKCEECKKIFVDIPTLAEHKGLVHNRAWILYDNLVTGLAEMPCLREQGSLGNSFGCFNCGLTPLNVIGLLEHITNEHYPNLAISFIEEFRNIILTPENTCPLYECRRKVENREELIVHIGVDHMKVMDEYLKQIAGSVAHNVLDKYYQAMLPNLNCVRDPSSCNKSFKSRTELNLHLCKSHFVMELEEKFIFHSRPIHTNFRKCVICQEDFTITDGPMHLGLEHHYLEDCLKESPLTCDDDDEVAPQVVLRYSTSSAETAVARTSTRVALTSNVPVLVGGDKDYAAWSFSCPKCTFKVHLTDYNQEISKKIATHYFKTHRQEHKSADEMIKGRDCLLCLESFESLKLTERHFLTRHVDALFHFFFDALPGKNFSKNLSKGGEEIKQNSVVDLYLEYLEFAKKKQEAPESVDPRQVKFFLNALKNNRKLEKKQLVPILQLISDCHVPLPDGSRLIKSPCLDAFAIANDTQGADSDVLTNSVQEIRLSMTDESPVCSPIDSSPVLGQSLSDDDDLSPCPNSGKPLTCHKCEIDFQDMAQLIAHVKGSNHEGAVLTCRFCETFSFTCIGTDNISVVEAHLCAHVLSSEHLQNRFLGMNNKKRVTKTKTNREGLLCELCGRNMDLTGDHVLSREHKQRYDILIAWVAFCDARGISPVTCEINELEFFFKITFPKTKSNNQKKLDFYIQHALVVCSNMHDYSDGLSLFGTSEIDTLTFRTLSQGPVSPLPNFICFRCLRSEHDFDAFLDHLKSADHTTESSVTTKTSFLKCEPCSVTMDSTTTMCLHVFSSKHLENAWHYNNTVDRFSSFEPGPPANFCAMCSKQVDENDDRHLNSDVHRTRVKCAEKYLTFCSRNGLQPAEIGIESIQTFIEEIYRTTPICQIAEADVVLEVLNALHKPINGSKVCAINGIVSFHRTCKHANAQQRSLFKEDIYNLLNEAQLSQIARCPKCFTFCSHATGMVFHAFNSHGISPTNFLKMDEFSPTDDIFQCTTCKRKLKSAMSFALHVDMHHLKKEIHCLSCKSNYTSPAFFYIHDMCGFNRTISKTDRDAISKAINLYLARSVPKEKGVCPPSPEDTNENSVLSSERSTPAIYQPFAVVNLRSEGIGIIIRGSRRDLQLRPGMDPSCLNRVSDSTIQKIKTYQRNLAVGYKRKGPYTTSAETDGLPGAKRNCYSSPPQSPSLLFTRSETEGFCLTCENCQVEGCDHEAHESRRFFTDIMDHSMSTGHTNIKLLSKCTLSRSTVVAEDLLYSSKWHERVENDLAKELKRRTTRAKKNAQSIKCKFLGCEFEAPAQSDYLRHVKSHFERSVLHCD